MALKDVTFDCRLNVAQQPTTRQAERERERERVGKEREREGGERERVLGFKHPVNWKSERETLDFNILSTGREREFLEFNVRQPQSEKEGRRESLCSSHL